MPEIKRRAISMNNLISRAAAQSYMQHEKRRMEEFFKQKAAKRKHYPSRQSAHRRSTEQQEISSPLSPLSNSDHDERLFRVRIRQGETKN